MVKNYIIQLIGRIYRHTVDKASADIFFIGKCLIPEYGTADRTFYDLIRKIITFKTFYVFLYPSRFLYPLIF